MSATFRYTVTPFIVITAVMLAVIVLPYGAALAAAPAMPAAVDAYAAKAMVMMEAETGRALMERNADERLPMASTTKIMTAITVIQNARLDDVVTVAPEAEGVEPSSIYLTAGEHLTVEQLLYGLMLESGNDAAVALAVHVSGSVEAFCALMNETARGLGAESSNFLNPHGLPGEGHYTTARDLALITRQALKDGDFRRIVSTESYRAPWEGKSWDRIFKNKNKLLRQLPGCIGVKTGFTKKAGRCLVTAAERDGMTLITVVLNCPDMWGASDAMMEYGFEHVTQQVLLPAGSEVGRVMTEGLPRVTPLYIEEPLVVALLPGETAEIDIYAPDILDARFEPGAPVGQAVASVGGQPVASVDIWAYPTHHNTIFGAVKRIMSRWRVWAGNR